MSSSDDYESAKARYARIRHAAFASTVTDAVRLGLAPPSFRMTDIDEVALSTWRRTWIDHHPTGSGGWEWEALSRPFRKTPESFQIALWSGRKLCGLAVGSVSRKKSTLARSMLCLHYIEGTAERDHPLKGKVALMVVSAAEAYARALGLATLRIANPLEGAIPVYFGSGFPLLVLKARQYIVRSGWQVDRKFSEDMCDAARATPSWQNSEAVFDTSNSRGGAEAHNHGDQRTRSRAAHEEPARPARLAHPGAAR